MRQSGRAPARTLGRRQAGRLPVEQEPRRGGPGLVPSHGGSSGRSSFSSDEAHGLGETFLTVRDIEVRYGIGRTRAYQLVKESWFPDPVVEGSYRWSLTSLEVAEAAKAAGERGRQGVMAPKPKRQRRR